MKHLTLDQLVAYHLDELSNGEKGILEKHLHECSACQHELILLEGLHNEWINPVYVEPSSNLLNGIMLEIEQQDTTANTGFNKAKRHQAMKNRLIHLVIAAAATLLIFQFQPTKHVVDSNQHVVQTIEQTSSLMEKEKELAIPFSKFWKGAKH